MMKKVIKYTITVLVLVIVFFASKPVYMSMLTSQYFKTPTDATMSEWLAENYQEVLDGQKDYQFDLMIWSAPEDPSISCPIGEYLFPNPMKDYYKVTVLQSEKMIKIERTYTERYYYKDAINIYSGSRPEGSIEIRTETYQGQIYYLALKDDSIDFYYPENGSYALKTINDAEVAQAFSTLLFPEDLGFLEKINSNHGVTHSKGGGVAMEVNREIDMTVLYEPFRLMLHDKVIPAEFPIANFRILVDEDDENVIAFELNLMSITEYLDYAYIAVYSEKPDNPLGNVDFEYEQNLFLTFYPDQFDVEKFDLPNVD